MGFKKIRQLSEVIFLIPGQVGAVGEDSWTVSGQKDNVWGVKLDLHGDNRHDSLEHSASRHISEAVQTRSAGGFSVQELPLGPEDHEGQ